MAETKEKILRLIDEVARTRGVDSARAAEELLQTVRGMNKALSEVEAAGTENADTSESSSALTHAATG